MPIPFDVFGKRMFIERSGNRWLLFIDSGSGMRVMADDVIILPDLTEDELAGFLDDIYHEHATESHPSVERLE